MGGDGGDEEEGRERMEEERGKVTDSCRGNGRDGTGHGAGREGGKGGERLQPPQTSYSWRRHCSSHVQSTGFSSLYVIQQSCIIVQFF